MPFAAIRASNKATISAPTRPWSCPCAKPQEYRSETPEILEWLSRRWLYNIPRSLKTEGIRPLGRLALVDHASEAVRPAACMAIN